jgi:hypothetical protein
MPNIKFLKIIFLGTLAVLMLFGCSEDDKATNGGGTGGVYADLLVSRFYFSGGSGLLVFSDTVIASLDSIYAPADPVKPYGPLTITCNDDTLQWLADRRLHEYSTGELEGFLTPGQTYIFEVGPDQGVPAFEKSIDFPSNLPFISYPVVSVPPNWLDTISLATGFKATWSGTQTGNVELIICDSEEASTYPTDTLLVLETENDGSYSFSSEELSGLTADNMYRLILTLKNEEAIVYNDYDERSRIIARIITSSTFYAM